jgi:hypothetical protein
MAAQMLPVELKVFLGTDPQPMVEQRLEWHRRKLAELEGYLERVRAAEWPAGIERSLIAGTTYHRVLVDLTSEPAGATREVPAPADHHVSR